MMPAATEGIASTHPPEDWDDGYSDDDQVDIFSNQFDDNMEDFGFAIPTQMYLRPNTETQETCADSSDEEGPLELDDFNFDCPASHNQRKSQNHIPSTVPFWFGDEDPLHIQRVVSIYEKILGVEKQRKECLRADPLFVGRVLRRQIHNKESDLFTTLDVVDIYINEFVPIGLSMPLSKQLCVLTAWDSQSGLPADQTIVSRKDAKTIWKPSLTPGVRAWMFCFPQHGSKCSFTYSSSTEERSMRCSNEPFTYQIFLPKRAIDDDDMNYINRGSPGGSPQLPPPKFHF